MLDLNDDLSDLIGNGPRAIPAPADYAHLQALHTEQCPKCHGSGKFRGYTGRVLGDCFACKGAGSRSFKTAPTVRQAAAERRAAAPQGRWEAFVAAHPAEAAWIVSTSFDFAVSMKQVVEKYGDLTERQMATVQRLTAAAAEKVAQKAQAVAHRQQEAPGVDASKIVAAIQQGKASGLKWVCLRFLGLMIYEAKKFPDVLYVKSAGNIYLGKIAEGRFIASRDCTPEQQAAIIVIASDPATAAKVYGLQTSSCCVCGKELTNKESIETGIGPICGRRLGFTPGGIKVFPVAP